MQKEKNKKKKKKSLWFNKLQILYKILGVNYMQNTNVQEK